MKNKFTISPFAAEDKQLVLNDNLSHFEKETWVAGYLWWPIDDEWMDRYMNEKGMVGLYNFHWNGEKVGNFSIWLDDKCEEGTIRVTRLMIYRKYRHKIIDREPIAWWLLDTAVKTAQELYPDLIPYGIAYDHSRNEKHKRKSSMLAMDKRYGFEEVKRKAYKSGDFIIADKIWLRLKQDK